MTSSTHALVDRLTGTFPQLLRLREEHLEAFGELLPHVLFGELTAWLVDEYAAAPQAGPEAAWRRILADLERAYEAGDVDTRELLYVSFLENLPYPQEPGAGITGHLGPHLAADLAEQRRA
jgi:hypothetical protein